MSQPEQARQFFKTRLPLILSVYILIQPLLDVLTTPSANVGAVVSVGVVVRTLFMAFACVYVVFFSHFQGKKWALIYLGALIAYLLLFMVQMFRLGGISLCVSNVKELIKVFFLPFVAVFLWAVYREYGYRISSRSIAWACGLYAFVILLAYVTGTSLVSYRSGYGFKGWFYAANEVGCIIAITTPIAIWFCLKRLPAVTKKTWWRGVLIGLCLISIVFAANYIGTKIVFAVVLVYCLAAFIWCVVRAIRERSRANTAAMAVMAAMVAAIMLLLPTSPLKGYISNVYRPLANETSEDVIHKWGEQEDPNDPEDPDESIKTGLLDASEGTWLRELIARNAVVQKLDQLLSRRLIVSSPAVQAYIDGGGATKLLGVGYGNCVAYGREVTRLVELDGLSILIRQGILGTLLYLVPYLLAIIYAVIQFFRHPLKRLSSLKYCSYLYSTLVAFAISMVAGHVLGAPAVGIFMLAATVNTLLMTREQNRGQEIG